jgi:multidrug efflux system membrane fusion protein
MQPVARVRIEKPDPYLFCNARFNTDLGCTKQSASTFAVLENPMQAFIKEKSSRALLLVILSASSAAIGCKQTPNATPAVAVASVEAAPVITRQIRVSDEFNGRVWATDYVDIRPRVTGYVDRIAFREGQMVRKGDLLFVIDPRPYKDAADSATAELDRQHAAADFAKIQSDRVERLKLSDAVSQEEQQNRSSDLLQSKARVKAAEAAVASAALNLSYTEVRSPINGRTSRTQLTL